MPFIQITPSPKIYQGVENVGEVFGIDSNRTKTQSHSVLNINEHDSRSRWIA